MLIAQNLQIRCLQSRNSVRSSAITAYNHARSQSFKIHRRTFSNRPVHADVVTRAARGPGRPYSDQPDDGEGEFEDVLAADDEEEFEEPTLEMLEKLQGEFAITACTVCSCIAFACIFSSTSYYPCSGDLGFVEDEGEDEEEARQERLRLEQEAASSESSFPEPEERGYYLFNLYGKAAYLDASMMMEHGTSHMCFSIAALIYCNLAQSPLFSDFPDAVVYGIQSNPEKVVSHEFIRS